MDISAITESSNVQEELPTEEHESEKAKPKITSTNLEKHEGKKRILGKKYFQEYPTTSN